MCFGARLNGCGKSRLTGFDPRTVQPLANRYKDCVIPATVAFMSLENVVLLVTVIPHLLKSVYTTTIFLLRLVSRHSTSTRHDFLEINFKEKTNSIVTERYVLLYE